MAGTPQELLQQLQDALLLGEFLESDYKKLKFKLFKGLTDLGLPLPTATGSIVQTEIVDSNETPYCYVQDEAFMYGADNHFAEIKAPYYIAKYPVTVGEFLHFVHETGYDFNEQARAAMLATSPSSDCPAVGVSWADAKTYCQWMRRLTREYYNLPSEYEWEKAARGVDGRFYPWGNFGPLDGRCRYQADETIQTTVPVHQHRDNTGPSGAIGMIGNCWEWCADPCDAKPGAHMVRGGSWANDADYISTVSRSYVGPETERSPIVGFRLTYIPSDLLFQYKNTETPAAINRSEATILYMDDLIDERMRSGNRDNPASISAQLNLALFEADGDRREAVQALSVEIVDTLTQLAAEVRSRAAQPPGRIELVDADSAAPGRIKLTRKND